MSPSHVPTQIYTEMRIGIDLALRSSVNDSHASPQLLPVHANLASAISQAAETNNNNSNFFSWLWLALTNKSLALRQPGGGPSLINEIRCDVSDDGRRRRKKKAGSSEGPLTSMPTVGLEKHRQKMSGAGGDDDEEQEEKKAIDKRQTALSTTHILNLDAIPEDPEIGQLNEDSYLYYERFTLSFLRPGLGGKPGSCIHTVPTIRFSLPGGRTLGKALSAFLLLPIRLLSKVPLGLLAYFIVATTIAWAA
ncbi:hypothetical protein BDP27DRAFT_1371242 [Rhodocollybia butyracea]|uniref:Uncharacterized protein n=1 Tax=Rhodocollybia butyracea TaxID=206335 RepID=A0A9P5P7E5_9AGAR|nr:hypothetical protein BDP27DRAFT_1371242 [Rhodocollybia butyracea]